MLPFARRSGAGGTWLRLALALRLLPLALGLVGILVAAIYVGLVWYSARWPDNATEELDPDFQEGESDALFADASEI